MMGTRAERYARCLPVLRALYVGGATLDDAARHCDDQGGPVSRNTAARWRKQAEAASGRSWDELRAKAAAAAAAGEYTAPKLAQKAANVLGWLLDNQAEQLRADPKGYCDALAKAQAIYQSLIETLNDPARIEIGLYVFAEWAGAKLTDADCAVVAQYLRAFRTAIADGHWEVRP